MKRRYALFGLLYGGWLFLITSCAQIPLTHYYTFRPDPEFGDKKPATLPYILAVGTFEAETPYQQDRIVFRTSPYEVAFYEYHRWLRPLEELVPNHIMHIVSASAMFSHVHDQAFELFADYILSGKISMFDRWDTKFPSIARIQITYQLIHAQSDKIVWMDTIDSTAPIAHLKFVVDTVKGFETALSENVQQALTAIDEVLSQQL